MESVSLAEVRNAHKDEVDDLDVAFKLHMEEALATSAELSQPGGVKRKATTLAGGGSLISAETV